jgi:hypothetical protein
VDPTNDPGRQLIRNWGSDPGRNVLDYSLASNSIAAGMPLLEKDDFGGCRAQDDGQPIETDAEAPTGIPTPPPTEAGPSSSMRERSSTRRSSSQSLSARRDSFHLLPPEENGNIYNSNPFAATNGSSPQPHIQQFAPPPNSTTSFPTGEYPNHPASYSGVAQMHPTQMAMPGMNQAPNGMVSMTQAELFTLVDMARQYRMPYGPWSGQVPMPSSQANMQQFMLSQQNGMMHQPFQDSQFPRVSQNPRLDVNNPTQHRVSPSHPPDNHTFGPSSPQVIPPSSIIRRSSPSRSKGKGKALADPLTSSYRRNASPRTFDTPASSSSSFRSPSPPPKHGSPRKTGQIFTTPSGAPLFFFVQVDLRNRASVVNKIKVRPCLHWMIFVLTALIEKWGQDHWRKPQSGLCHLVFRFGFLQ